MISRRALMAAGSSVCLGCALGRAGRPSLGAFADSLPGETAVGGWFDPAVLKGRVVLITFVATWCFPCLADLVVIEKLEASHGPKGFSSILVGMDLEGRRVLEPFAINSGLRAPLLVGDDRIRSAATKFGRIRELPSHLLFGRDGALVVAFTGVAGLHELTRLVDVELERSAG
jgi:thiol-disulfide isomerase/thioredoxin